MATISRDDVSPNGDSPAPDVLTRVPLTVDPLGSDGGQLPGQTDARLASAENLYAGMASLSANLAVVSTSLAAPAAPGQLIGVLEQPDGTPAASVQVQFDPTSFGFQSPIVTAQTDEKGAFRLPLPAAMSIPRDSSLRLKVHGTGPAIVVDVSTDSIAANGLMGAVTLPSFVARLPRSIVAALEHLAPPPPPGTTPVPATSSTVPQRPVVKIGEDAESSLLAYTMNTATESYPYGVFFRLVEPRASIVTKVRRQLNDNGLYSYLPFFTMNWAPVMPETESDKVDYIDRVPIDQPVSVDGFRDQIMGLQRDGTFTGDETRPMAGTLGLGYILYLSQRWTYQGLTLGDLVYSLPLAPGEQQQLAVFERIGSSQVTDIESLDEEQAQQQRALADTSTQATFNSAFEEAVAGQSAFATKSTTKSGAISFIFAAASVGESEAGGSASTSLHGQRSTTQQAAQKTHSSAENQASARRRAARTGMRIASVSDSQTLSTRTITNHNKTRALTMQYWEVERLYDVTTAIDGLSLTVLVPLQVVRFMPPGQAATLRTAYDVNERYKVIERYKLIVKHAEVLARDLPQRHQRGLARLMDFASDPTASVQASDGPAADVVALSMSGTFVPCEEVWVTAVTKDGGRVGPVSMSPTADVASPPKTLSTREQLVDWLNGLRHGTPSPLQGQLVIPSSVGRDGVVGFEVSRTFRTLSHVLTSQSMRDLDRLYGLFGTNQSWVSQALQSTFVPPPRGQETVFLTPSELEKALGGPRLHSFDATIGGDTSLVAQQAQGNIRLTTTPYPIAARQIGPVLRYADILEIERMASHVVRGTLPYSRSVWASMSPDERAILLEAYTIGVAPGGVQDASQMVPLLNCVENRVLGFFGNSMIMPFTIPQSLAMHGTGGTPIDPAKVEESLLAYQRAAFTPPKSTIALPTNGVLGEAVLGHGAAAEKIDLTRFWNWQDSPADSAPAIAPSVLPTGSAALTAGLEGPSDLANRPSLINNVLSAPSPDSSLLQALAKEAAAQKGFDVSLTGAAQLAGLVTNAQNVSNAARQDALKSATDTTQQTIATIGNIGGGLTGNPDAGTNALAAQKGTKGPEPAKKKEEKPDDKPKGDKDAKPAAPAKPAPPVITEA